MIIFYFIFLLGHVLSDLSTSYFIMLGVGDDIHNFAETITSTKDGGYVIAGRTWAYGKSRLLLVKLYSNLTVVWGASVGNFDDVEYIGASIFETRNGDLLVGGHVYDIDNELLIARFSSNGTKKWLFTMTGKDAGGGRVNCLIESSDLGIVFSGYTESLEYLGNQYKPFLSKLNGETGDLEWFTVVRRIENEQIVEGDTGDGKSVIETSSGNLIVSGWLKRSGELSTQLFLSSYTSIGYLEWTRVFGTSDAEERGQYALETTDGGLVVCGMTESFGKDNKADILLAKFTIEGEIVWAKYVGGYEGDYTNTMISANNDEGYVITGSSYNFDSFESGFTIKFSINGTLQWCNAMNPFGKTALTNDITQTADGQGYLVAGTSSGLPHDTALLATISEDGNSCSLGERILPSDFLYDDYISNPESLFLGWEVVSISIPISNLSFYFDIEYKVTNDTIYSPSRFQVDRYCESPNCYGQFDTHACSSRGNCTNTDTCDCFENFFGEQCEVSECFGVLGNETEDESGIPRYCSGNGHCVDYNDCACDYDFYGEECSLRQSVSFVHVWDGLDYCGIFVEDMMISSIDGSYIMVGATMCSFEDYDFDMYVAKFSPNGTLEYLNSLFGTDNPNKVAYSVVESDEGGYFVAGTAYTLPDWHVLLVKYFANGSVDWVNGYPGGDARDLVVSMDGNYCFVTGKTASNDLFAAMFHSGNGSVVWAKTLVGEDTDVGNSAVESSTDGGFVVVGYTKSTGAGRRDILVAKFGRPEGGLDWIITIGGTQDDEGLAIAEMNGEFFVTGYTASFGAGWKDLYLAKIGGSGELLWSYAYGAWQGEEGRDIYVSEDENQIIIMGWTDSFKTNGAFVYSDRMFMFEFNLDGELQSAELVRGDNTMVPSSFARAEDGGYVIAGKENNDVLLMKTYDGISNGCYKDHPGYANLIDSISTFGLYGLSAVQYADAPILGSSLENSFRENMTLLAPNVTDLTSYFEMTMWDYCHVEYTCFGEFEEGDQCSGHGDCIYYDTCQCTNYSRNFGPECEVHECYGILSNQSSSNNIDFPCSHHGECIDHDNCICDTNYTLSKDCSRWNCFGVLNNETQKVCSGGHGNCTHMDFCTCEEGYRSSSNCDWDCFGFDHRLEESCGEYGICLDHDVCQCDPSEKYIGERCDTPTCQNVSSEHTIEVCSGHGECVSPDTCECFIGYDSTVSGECDWWTCSGYHWELNTKTCSGHGQCVGYNDCECDDGYDEGLECELWLCSGELKDSVSACSGNGVCEKPNFCHCDVTYYGDECEKNILYLTLMTPALSLSGFLVICIVASCIVCCCCVCCVVGLMGVVLGSVMCCSIVFQRFRLKKFGRLKNVDLLLREQELEEDDSIAHIRINNNLFQIPMEEIELESIIGEGGSSSVVYKVKWRKRTFAFKCFKTRSICHSQHSFDEFEREIEVLASTSHPNIIRFFGGCLSPPRVGILMEFCENGDLSDFLKKYNKVNDGKRYPFHEKIRMILEISSSLSYLHSRSIIHRDIKLENVLVDESERIRLMDFGLSKIVDRMSNHKTLRIGTPFFMPPELILNSSYDEKCDVYSFSILVYIVLTEEYFPYGKENSVSGAGIEIRVSQDPQYRPSLEVFRKNVFEEEVGSILEDLLVRCWDHSPKKRYSFDEIVEILEKKVSCKMIQDSMGDERGRGQRRRMKSALSTTTSSKSFQRGSDEEKRFFDGDDGDDGDIMKMKKRIEELEKKNLELVGFYEEKIKKLEKKLQQ